MSCLPLRSASPGKSTSSLLGSLRKTASSRSKGRLVAPTTTIRLSLLIAAELRPSISCMNSVNNWSCALCPIPPPRADRAPNRASTSSRKITQGESRRASENTAFTLSCQRQRNTQITDNFSPSPIYLSLTSLGCIASILAPLSLATALAKSVLPVPGGPKSSAPVVAWSFKTPPRKASGKRRGRDITVRMPSIVL